MGFRKLPWALFFFLLLGGEQEEIVTYKSVWHPSNIKTWLFIGLWRIHLKWLWPEWYGDFVFKSSVKLSKTFTFKVFMSNEWEVRLHVIIPTSWLFPSRIWIKLYEVGGKWIMLSLKRGQIYSPGQRACGEPNFVVHEFGLCLTWSWMQEGLNFVLKQNAHVLYIACFPSSSPNFLRPLVIMSPQFWTDLFIESRSTQSMDRRVLRHPEKWNQPNLFK